MRTQFVGVSAAGGETSLLPAYCFATDHVGDAVYFMGNRVGIHFQVTRVNIDDSNPRKATARAIIVSKSDPSTCTILISGLLEGIYTGLTYGATVFVGTDGRLTTEKPAQPLTGSRLIQRVGSVLDSSCIAISFETPVRSVST